MLAEDDVLKIYRWYVEGMAVRDIAKHFDIAEPYVYSIVKGKVYKPLHSIYFPHKEVKK